jgi:Uma2 family endonuclease
MSNTTVKFTYQDLLTAPDDGNRYEIFEGELIVTPSPTVKHQNALHNLTLLLGQHIKNNKLGKMYSAPMDVYFDEETVVEPDLLFVSNKRLHILEERRINGAPDLVVEILSPGTAERDRGFKFRRYEKEGVNEYWIVDPVEEHVEIYTPQKNGYELFDQFSNDDEISPPLFSELSFKLSELWE